MSALRGLASVGRTAVNAFCADCFNGPQFGDDDPYAGELNLFLDQVPAAAPAGAADDSALADDDEDPTASQILSSYEDASKTYALTWKIRDVSEANTKRFKKSEKK